MGGKKASKEKEQRGRGVSFLYYCLVAKMSELTVGQMNTTESSRFRHLAMPTVVSSKKL